MNRHTKYFSILIAIAFILSACGRYSATATPTPFPSDAPTKKYPVLPTLTPIKIPSPTISPTGTITPIPTIPTFTPTFDIRTIVTVTPAPAAVCPKINPELVIDLGIDKIRACLDLAKTAHTNPGDCANRNIQNDILEYLNQGGDIKKILAQFLLDGQKENVDFGNQDLTGDSVPELFFHDVHAMYPAYYFYKCDNGRYSIQYGTGGGESGLRIYSIQDLNRDSIPEVVFTIQLVLFVIGWDGNQFKEILGIRDFGSCSYKILDINGDGLKEVILFREFPPMWSEWLEWPWRSYTSIYGWNGNSFVLFSKEFAPPVYRFQAIQDAEQYVLNGIYDKAISSYQDAIFKSELEWWSPERRKNELAVHEYAAIGTATPSLPTPVPDTTEYPRLAAYAYYRMIALHVYLGEMDAATVQYNTLQTKFRAGNPGHPYVEMATAFWDAYQSSANMTTACTAAIQYAVVHPEILVPLGSDYHGWQSHRYYPEDVCPFR